MALWGRLDCKDAAGLPTELLPARPAREAGRSASPRGGGHSYSPSRGATSGGGATDTLSPRKYQGAASSSSSSSAPPGASLPPPMPRGPGNLVSGAGGGPAAARAASTEPSAGFTGGIAVEEGVVRPERSRRLSGRGPTSPSAALQQEESTVRVIARFRPPDRQERESEGSARAFFVWPDRRTVESMDRSHSFEFDYAFCEDSRQSAIYDAAGRPMIDDLLEGYNGTVLAYGQTGSGKSYCMFGAGHERSQCPFSATAHDPLMLGDESRGVVQRAAKHVFERINAGPDNTEFHLRCSLFEVYREQLRDLLDPSNTSLKVKETPQQGIFVDGLVHEIVAGETDITDLLRIGSRMRAVAATQLNQHSSRSHVIFSLICQQRSQDGTEKIGKLHLVDLAGSENVGRSNSTGVTLEEAKKINWSLSALGNVINALSEKRPHVPYRDSKLTRILQETLGGNFKTSLIVTCSPLHRHLDETISSLNFAARAKTICNHVSVNIVYGTGQLMALASQLKHDLFITRREVARRGGVCCPSSMSLVGQHGDMCNFEASINCSNLNASQAVCQDSEFAQHCDEETVARKTESLKSTKAALATKLLEMKKHMETSQAALRAAHDFGKLGELPKDDGASAAIDQLTLCLRRDILQQELTVWELQSQQAQDEDRMTERERHCKCMRSRCSSLRALISEARGEFERLNDNSVCQGTLGLHSDTSPSAPRRSSPVSLPVSSSVPVAHATLQPEDRRAVRVSLANVLAEYSHSLPIVEAKQQQEEEEQLPSEMGKNMVADTCKVACPALTRSQLRHKLKMLRLDSDRDEDRQHRLINRQEEDFRQWIISAKIKMDALDASGAESQQEELRLQALLQQRQAELEGLLRRAQMSRLTARLAKQREAQLEEAVALLLCRSNDRGNTVNSRTDAGGSSSNGEASALKQIRSRGCEAAPAWMRDACNQVCSTVDTLTGRAQKLGGA